jgi:hypothetical protein
MAGRSIEDILRQQAAQRQAQIQQQQAQERALHEQRERARQDYLQRMRMFEKLSNTNPAAAASAAAGGHTTPIINGHTEIILFSTTDSSNWHYVILDFQHDTISDSKDTGISNSLNINHYYVIDNTGYVVKISDNYLCINDSTHIVKTITGSYGVHAKSDLVIFYDETAGEINYFDGKVFSTFTGAPVSPNSYNLTRGGYLIIEYRNSDNGDITIYNWTPTDGLTSIYTDVYWGFTGEYNGIDVDPSVPFFCVEINPGGHWKKIKIIGEQGDARSILDVDALSGGTMASGYIQFYGDSKVEWQFNAFGGSVRYIGNYDYNTDTWKTTRHNTTANYVNQENVFQYSPIGTQFTSPSNGKVNLFHDGASGSQYNIDLYRHLDVIWTIDGGNYLTYSVNNTTTWSKGVDLNDASRDYGNNTLYCGKSMFFPMWLNNSYLSLLCLTSTQSVVIQAGSTTGLTGSQGYGHIPGWYNGQRYATFRVGDYFGIWLAYATSDVYKIYDYTGNKVVSLTMSVGTYLNYRGNIAVITTPTTDYLFAESTLGASPSYATYSNLGWNAIGQSPDYSSTEDASLIINSNLSTGQFRIFKNPGAIDGTVPSGKISYAFASTTYVGFVDDSSGSVVVYLYDSDANLLQTADLGVSSINNWFIVEDRINLEKDNGSTKTFWYVSPTKVDTKVIKNVSSYDVYYDNYNWWAQQSWC